MKVSFLQQPVLSTPDGIDPERYSLCRLGPLALGLSLGMQLMITALLHPGVSSNQRFIAQLSEWGKSITRPEHDLEVYIAGVLAALVAMALILGWWQARLARLPAVKARRFMTASSLLCAVLAVASILAYAALLVSDWFSRDFEFSHSAIRGPAGQFDEVTLMVPGVMALLCVALDIRLGFLDSLELPARFGLWQRCIGRALHYATPVFIILVVGVPPAKWRVLADQFFLTDGCQHLNFFMMGPALAFSHGGAFGTEIYSQYGIGWPLLLSSLSHLSALTYANLVGMQISYACVYYIALFFLLRTCFGEAIWAAIGVVLAIYWQIFCGMSEGRVIWLTPSSTLMRHPMDVWFFLTLVIYQRRGGTTWLGMAGAIAGGATFFETETGTYLLVTFLVYWILRAGLARGKGRPEGKRAFLLPPFVFYVAALATLLPLLWYASRGTLFTAAFWGGWIEALVKFGGMGVSALPISELPDAPLIFFLIMVTIYLAIIAHAVASGLHGDAGQSQVLLATLAAYGLALLLLFVNRSHPYNLCHASTALAVVVTTLLFLARKRLAGALPFSSVSFVLAGGLVLLLLTKADFLRYPSCLKSSFETARPDGLTANSTIAKASGLPAHAEDFVQRFAGVSAAIRAVAPDGRDVAILDSSDTVLYYAANTKPWSRYTSVFYMLLTSQSLQDLRRELIEKPPRCVVIRGQDVLRPSKWEFAWRPLYQVVTNRYALRQTVSSYEIWQLPIQAPANRAATGFREPKVAKEAKD